MKNLAGVKGCDEFIRDELAEAGIAALLLPGEDKSKHEVPWQVIGLLGGRTYLNELAKYPENSIIRAHQRVEFIDADIASFKFIRCWYYWSVTGYVPMDVAMEMYNDPIGRTAIRVEGHCGCPSPEDYTSQPLVAGKQCIRSYHIDSQEGLNLFVETLRKHNLF